jgi:hypothetical protein
MGPHKSFLLDSPVVPGPQPGGEAGSHLWGFIEPQESAIQLINTEGGGQNISLPGV